MAKNCPPYSREKRAAIMQPEFLQLLENSKTTDEIAFRFLILPFSEAIEERQNEMSGLGRELLDLLEADEKEHDEEMLS